MLMKSSSAWGPVSLLTRGCRRKANVLRLGAERPKKGASLFFLAFWGFAWRFEGGFTPFTPTSLLKKA